MQGVTRQTGIISDIDEAVVRVRVTLPECDDLKSNWLPVLQRNTQTTKITGYRILANRLKSCLMTTARTALCSGPSIPPWIRHRWPPATNAMCSFPTAPLLNTIASYTSSLSTAVSKNRHRGTG